MRRDRIALADPRVDPRVFRKTEMVQRTSRGQKPFCRIFGIDARLEGMAVQLDLFLIERQLLAGGDAQLPFHQIEPGHEFGHRMLDLQSRVHLHEPETVGTKPLRTVDNEFDRAGAAIVDGLRRIDGGLRHRGAHVVGNSRSGRFLDHLLMAALQRTIAFEQMHDVAVIVAKDLHFDMARLLDEFLNQHPLIAECRERLALGGGQRLAEILGPVDLAHTLAPTAGARLDQYRIADLIGLAGKHDRFLRLAVIARNDRNARLFHGQLGGVLQPHGADGFRRRPDEDQSRLFDFFNEIGILGKKAIAGMNRFRPGFARRIDDRIHAQIAFIDGRRSDAH